MKTTRLIIITAFVGVMLFGSYVLGVKRTKDRLTVLSLGTLSQAMTAMQAIRSGDTTEALGPLESLCYANAVMLLASPRWRDDFATGAFMPELVAYRDLYATNPITWTPMEVSLNELLIQYGWKTEREHAPPEERGVPPRP